MSTQVATIVQYALQNANHGALTRYVLGKDTQLFTITVNYSGRQLALE
ncbi:MAG: hypothetical protein ABJI60_05140 [Kangiellaceae bacterium]